MKWVLSKRVPPITRILLVESGPQAVSEAVLPRLREAFGAETPIDRLTWTASAASEEPRIWRSADYGSASRRFALLRTIRRQRAPVVAVVCANTPYLRSWRTAILLAVPAKILIVNENADFFWLDRGNAGNVRQLLLGRRGGFSESAVHLVGRAVLFPFAFVYLCAYAAVIHIRRYFKTRLGRRLRPA